MDSVTPTAVQEFLETMPRAETKYILQVLGAFTAAKEVWRQKRVRSDCVATTKVVVNLFASGASASVAVTQLDLVSQRLAALLHGQQSDAERIFATFMNLLLDSIKALALCPVASGLVS